MFIKINWCEAKWFFQKIFRGYSDPEIWGLCDTLSRWLLPRLDAFIKSRPHGWNDQTCKSYAEYMQNLKDVRWAISAIAQEDGGGPIRGDLKRYDRVLKMPLSILLGLWD